MICTHPESVFEGHTDLSRELLSSAKPMLESFLYVTRAMSREGGALSWQDLMRDGDNNHALARALCECLPIYLRHFKNWKVQGEFIDTLCKLTRAEQGLPVDESSAEMRALLQARQAAVKDRLKKMGGESALAEFERKLALEPQMMGMEKRIVHGPNVSRVRMNNEWITYELLRNPLFKFHNKENPDDIVHTRLGHSLDTKFWEAFANGLKASPPEYTRILDIVREFDSWKEFDLEQSEELRAAEAGLNVKNIQQQIESGSMNWEGLEKLVDCMASFIIYLYQYLKNKDGQCRVARQASIFQAMMRNARDLPTQAADQQGAGEQMLQMEMLGKGMAEAFQFLTSESYNIRVEFCNIKVDTMRPIIQEGGEVYLLKALEEKLSEGTVTLESTAQWVQHTVEGIIARRDPRPSPAALAGRLCGALADAVHVAFVELVSEFPHWGGVQRGQIEVPVLLKHEDCLIRALNAHFHTDVKTAVILGCIAKVRGDALCCLFLIFTWVIS